MSVPLPFPLSERACARGHRAQVVPTKRCPPAGPSLPAPPRGTTEPDRPPTFPPRPTLKGTEHCRRPPFPPPHHPSSNQAHGRRRLTPSTSCMSRLSDRHFPHRILSFRHRHCHLQGELHHSIDLTPKWAD
jgi:hypothetical protein